MAIDFMRGKKKLSAPINQRSLEFNSNTVPIGKRYLNELGFYTNKALGWVPLLNTGRLDTDSIFTYTRLMGDPQYSQYFTIMGDITTSIGFVRDLNLLPPGYNENQYIQNSVMTLECKDIKRVMFDFNAHTLGGSDPVPFTFTAMFTDGFSETVTLATPWDSYTPTNDMSKFDYFDFSADFWDGSGNVADIYQIYVSTQLAEVNPGNLVKISAKFNRYVYYIVDNIAATVDENNDKKFTYDMTVDPEVGTITFLVKLKNGQNTIWDDVVYNGDPSVEWVDNKDSSISITVTGTSQDFLSDNLVISIYAEDDVDMPYECKITLYSWWDATTSDHWTAWDTGVDGTSAVGGNGTVVYDGGYSSAFSNYTSNNSFYIHCEPLTDYGAGTDWPIQYRPKFVRIEYEDTQPVVLGFRLKNGYVQVGEIVSGKSYPIDLGSPSSGNLAAIYFTNSGEPTSKKITKIEFAPPPKVRQWYDVTDQSYWTVDAIDLTDGNVPWNTNHWRIPNYQQNIFADTHLWASEASYGTVIPTGTHVAIEGSMYSIDGAPIDLTVLSGSIFWDPIGTVSYGNGTTFVDNQYWTNGVPWNASGPGFHLLLFRVRNSANNKVKFFGYPFTALGSTTTYSNNDLYMHADLSNHPGWTTGVVKIELTTSTPSITGNIDITLEDIYANGQVVSSTTSSSQSSNSWVENNGSAIRALNAAQTSITGYDVGTVNFGDILIRNNNVTTEFDVTRIRVLK
jgi:hypothetical protein